MPTCKKCGCSDPALFYEYQPGECKACACARVRANRQARLDYYRAFDRERSKKPGRKAQYAEKQKRMRSSITGLESAHSAVARAVRAGVLIRPSVCSRCPSTDRIQAHHDDHTRHLEVMWLCPVCHAARHRELGRVHGLTVERRRRGDLDRGLHEYRVVPP